MVVRPRRASRWNRALLRAGPVTARLVGRDLRNVRFGGAEIAQRIYVAVRDRNWDTIPGEVSDLTVEQGTTASPSASPSPTASTTSTGSGRGEIRGEPDGTISYAMDAIAGADMTYKLIGLNVHHGMRDYAGRPCHGTTPDGPIVDAFPTEVAPQLIADQTEVPIFPPVESLTADSPTTSPSGSTTRATPSSSRTSATGPTPPSSRSRTRRAAAASTPSAPGSGSGRR